MFGLKIPTVWLNSAFMLPVSQAEHLIKTHLGLNAKNQDGHIQNWRDLIFTLQRNTESRMIPWFSYMGLYNLLHHSGPSQLPLTFISSSPGMYTHTHTHTHTWWDVLLKLKHWISKKNTKVKVLILIISSTIIYWTSKSIYWALPLWYLIF